jgi:AcrR family transcriptional regulator
VKVTRRRIVEAARELLSEGAFHEATVEEIAARAGVSRATFYQHFDSRFGVIDAICEVIEDNPALVAIRRSVAEDEPEQALERVLTESVNLWSSEEPMIAQLFGLAAIDPAAADYVERQLRDRRTVLESLLRRLSASGRLKTGLSARRALARLLLLTAFPTFVELRRGAGLPEREVVRMLVESARTELLATP